MTTDIKLYEVGGCVRDAIRGVASKDVDFVAIAPSYDAMREHLVSQGFRIFVEKPEFVTIRCSIPADHPLRARAKDADFVLARKDGPTADGRRPQFVEPGTLEDDLARRDFSMNAVARDPLSGEFVDPHGGIEDIRRRLIRFVGDPMTRIREDGLRVLRGLRFAVTLDFTIDERSLDAMLSVEAASMLAAVSEERTRDEVEKMCAANTIRTVSILGNLPDHTKGAIFRGRLRLSATLKSARSTLTGT